MEGEFKPSNKNAIYLTLANPPTFGDAFILAQLAEKYDNVLVMVYDKPTVLPTRDVLVYLTVLTKQFTCDCGNKPNFLVIATPLDFTRISILPNDTNGVPINKEADIITTSTHIYSNLKAKGISNTYLVKKPYGYKDMFHRLAFSRSMIYEKLKRIVG